ncbi:hypothetical protein BKH46_08915 [Helicobacter sp. 12S02634-8]|uniref:hypothetical protein n=1 Tax=Helicobacter sp. 12S02634-8 TaxID=1476199 RepID=UPI000BA600E9|nr:hypothetical protein [Helicobacter sp. 12S02634-8]PAF46120.1 hypothetical protein BKH46_08915 [Helicobacter sp. 12S02634-8]
MDTLAPTTLQTDSTQEAQHPLLTELLERAKGSLENEEEVSCKIALKALSEMEEAVCKKRVPNFVKLDFAMVRLKLWLKIGLSEEDEMLLNKALKAIENAPLAQIEGLESAKCYLVKEREFLV